MAVPALVVAAINHQYLASVGGGFIFFAYKFFFGDDEERARRAEERANAMQAEADALRERLAAMTIVLEELRRKVQEANAATEKAQEEARLAKLAAEKSRNESLASQEENKNANKEAKSAKADCDALKTIIDLLQDEAKKDKQSLFEIHAIVIAMQNKIVELSESNEEQSRYKLVLERIIKQNNRAHMSATEILSIIQTTLNQPLNDPIAELGRHPATLFTKTMSPGTTPIATAQKPLACNN